MELTFLKTHERTHTGEHSYKCKICNINFLHKKDSKEHQITYHKLIKPFICQICNFGYSKKSVLNNHQKIHLDLKPHKCPYPNCGKEFKEKGNLKSHFRIHVKLFLNFKEDFINYLDKIDKNHYNIIKTSLDPTENSIKIDDIDNGSENNYHGYQEFFNNSLRNFIYNH